MANQNNPLALALANGGIPTMDLSRFTTALVSSRNPAKTIGSRTVFGQSKSAADIRESFKAQGVKGKDLKEKVLAVLRGESDLRQQLGMAWLTASFQEGMVPDCGELRKGSGSLKLVKVTVEDAKAKALELENAELRATLAAFKAKLGIA